MRDPRVEPRVGDIVESDGIFLRVQADSHYPGLRILTVTVLTRDLPTPVIGVNIKMWRKRSSAATIIHAEGE